MSRPRAARAEQLPLPTPKPRPGFDPEEGARRAIARRAKPSAVPGYVKLVLTLEIPRELAERLSATAIRQSRSLEAVVIDRLKGGAR